MGCAGGPLPEAHPGTWRRRHRFGIETTSCLFSLRVAASSGDSRTNSTLSNVNV
jgi:hypothetical protein